MRRFRRILRIGGYAIVGLVALYALITAEENWRAKHDLEAVESALRARGEKLDLAEFVARRRDGPDIGALAAFQPENTAAGAPQTKPLDVAELFPEKTPSIGNCRIGKPPDFRTAKTESDAMSDSPAAARVVLAGLQPADEQLGQIAAAVREPDAHFQFNYERGFAIPLPQLAPLLRWSRLSALHAVASLRAGDADAAMRDTETLLALQQTLRDEPLLIMLLIRLTQLAQLEQVVWEGERDGAWTAAQWLVIDQQLRTIDLLADFQTVARGERACMRRGFALISRAEFDNFNTALEPFGFPTGIPRWLIAVTPARALIARNEAVIETWIEDQLLPVCDSRQHRIFVERAEAADDARTQIPTTPYTALAKAALPVYRGITIRVAAEAVAVDQMRFACSNRLARLHNTAPPPPPNDLISGETMKLTPAKDGYTLYSVGWNRSDDRGAVVRKGARRDDERGDWVWFGH